MIVADFVRRRRLQNRDPEPVEGHPSASAQDADFASPPVSKIRHRIRLTDCQRERKIPIPRLGFFV
jgi:hypothetical protein